jgi:filamin
MDVHKNNNVAFLIFTKSKCLLSGKGKASDINEVSSLYVETVEKKPGVSKAKRFHGDASKVVVQGAGLKKGFPGRPCAFSLDCKDAGDDQNKLIS